MYKLFCFYKYIDDRFIFRTVVQELRKVNDLSRLQRVKRQIFNLIMDAQDLDDDS